ncbi:hypothetical protein GGS21DRAFT_547363 [Xylaria nigripes]|nr:hypothetical protein GGS21DRAFT_547363 [Xylaria nigripes]
MDQNLEDPFIDQPQAQAAGQALTQARFYSAYDSDCSHEKLPATIVNFSGDCDMILMVGKEKCVNDECNKAHQKTVNRHQLNVDSTVLAGASPTLGFVVLSPSGIGKSDDAKWIVELPDDDPEAMITISLILYRRYPSSSTGVHKSLKQLLQLTILADKYDLVHIFARWSDQWVRDMQRYWFKKRLRGGSNKDFESLLWIFYVLGHEPLYSCMVLQLAFHSGVDKTGKLIDHRNRLRFKNETRDIPVPPMAAIEIAHVRMKALQLIRKEMKETLEDHLNGRARSDFVCCMRNDGANDRGWRRDILVLFVDMLQAHHIWPLPSVNGMKWSPRDFVELFRVNANIPAFTHYGFGRFCDARGTLWERLEKKILHRLRFNAAAATASHLREQAIKSGLDIHLRPNEDMLQPEQGNWNMDEIYQFQESMAKYGRTRRSSYPASV